MLLACGLGAASSSQAACQGEGLADLIWDGVTQAWSAVSGGDAHRSSVCPEVMRYPLPAAPPAVPPTSASIVTPKAALDASGDNDGDGVSDGLDWCQTTAAATRVDERGCGLMPAQVIHLPDRQFASDKDTLEPVLQNSLTELAERISATPGHEQLRIVGHADGQGDDSYNDDLSLRRAWGVADFLSSKGVALQDMDYEGKGKTMPIAENSSRQGRARNRRVEIIIN
jgi:outer membrane protein OmpA-like peptidoglycan-associated protein